MFLLLLFELQSWRASSLLIEVLGRVMLALYPTISFCLSNFALAYILTWHNECFLGLALKQMR